jgi:hypothetical protein
MVDMSRFLNQYRRMKKRVAKIRIAHLDVGRAMWEKAMYGTLPSSPALRALIKRFADCAMEMYLTVPKPEPDYGEDETLH